MKKQRKLSFFSFFTTSFIFILFTGCKTENLVLLPVVTTSEVTSISYNSAKSGGTITSVADSNIIARGVCWSATETPTIADNKTTDGGGIGSFTSSITGLIPATIYYVRAYATNIEGTGYGSAYQFTTSNNPLSISTVNIPAGTFTMGSPTTEVNRFSIETQHSVTLTAFRMSQYEITNAQYADFLNTKNIGSNGLYTAGTYSAETLIYSNSSMGLTYSDSQWIPVTGYENAPVIEVTWYGATEYASYVGGTLPTEAQWEYACRAGTNTPFNTGNFLTNLQANYNWAYPYNGGTNTVTTRPVKTQTVGTYGANDYGLFDMHGNVWEWCADWFGTYPTTAQTNPTGAATGTHRVIRGGSWSCNVLYCRSAARGGYEYPNDNFYDTGFRVVFVP